MAPLLRVVSSAEHEWRGDYQPLSRFARDQLGMSPSKARALLRLERAGEVCPELRAAHRSGRLSWVKAQCLLPLLLIDMPGEWRPAWVAWAARVTVRRPEADVERALLLRAGHHHAWQRCRYQPERAQTAIPLGERQMCAPDVDPEATRELVWRVPLEVATLHERHITFRSAGGSDAPGNLVTLCAFHHQRCLHAGRRVRGRAPDGLVFELGLRSGRPPLARYRSGDVALSPPELRFLVTA